MQQATFSSLWESSAFCCCQMQNIHGVREPAASDIFGQLALFFGALFTRRFLHLAAAGVFLRPGPGREQY